MRSLKRKGRLAVIALSGITITFICIEYLSYLHNSASWPNPSKNDDVTLRILLVADPQIQGEQLEPYLYGWITRWDSDRYLQKNYNLAKRHVSPNVVVFLGDLFDEGSIAIDPEYRRYSQRFKTIFDLPSQKDPSTTKYIFVPGDNDVGGERREPVDSVKIKWFSNTFGGDVRGVVDVAAKGLDVQFVKMNLFMPDEYNDPLKGFGTVINGTKRPDIRLIVSHVSLVSFMTNAVEEVIKNFQPSLILSAHSHSSSYLRYLPGSNKKSVHIINEFLLPKSFREGEEMGGDLSEFRKKSSFFLNVKQSDNYIHEIAVPTCSYRMGVPNMGYGVLNLYRNGTMEYTVLWLPSRFKQLFLYAAVYLMVKIIATPWICWKLTAYTLNKIRQCRLAEPTHEYARII